MGTLNYASNGQGYFGKSFNKTSLTKQTLASGTLDTPGRHITGTFNDDSNLCRIIVLLTNINSSIY